MFLINIFFSFSELPAEEGKKNLFELNLHCILDTFTNDIVCHYYFIF